MSEINWYKNIAAIRVEYTSYLGDMHRKNKTYRVIGTNSTGERVHQFIGSELSRSEAKDLAKYQHERLVKLFNHPCELYPTPIEAETPHMPEHARERSVHDQRKITPTYFTQQGRVSLKRKR